MQNSQIPRPKKKSEYTLVFDNSRSARGWRNLEAVRKNDLADAWDYLTKTPNLRNAFCNPLKWNLASILRNEIEYEVWQLKLSRTDGSRIWYFIDGQTVVIFEVFTNHPNQTK